jgi:hypothetical protein
MAFFLRPENASIWAQVQGLAQKGDDAGLRDYVREAQRLTTTQRNVRVAIAPGKLDGKDVQPGNLVVLMLVSFFPLPCYIHFPMLRLHLESLTAF